MKIIHEKFVDKNDIDIFSAEFSTSKYSIELVKSFDKIDSSDRVSNLAKQKNESFVIAGSGTPLRQFIYSEDLAILILWTLENYNEKEPIILSVPESQEKSIKILDVTAILLFVVESLNLLIWLFNQYLWLDLRFQILMELQCLFQLLLISKF
jgi:hypothetical protein